MTTDLNTMPTPPQTPHSIAAAVTAAANSQQIPVSLTAAPRDITGQPIDVVVEAPPADVKPGWKTSEFWLKCAAMALSAVFASGVLTTDRALAIAGIVATMLGALGYTVSRTMIKTAAGMLIAFVIGSAVLGSSACSSTTRARETAGAAAAIDCEDPNLKALVSDALPVAENYILSLLDPTGHKVDTSKLTADTDKITSTAEIMRCAIATALAVISTPAPANPSAPNAAPAVLEQSNAHAAWAQVRARHGWGDTHTSSGVW